MRAREEAGRRSRGVAGSIMRKEIKEGVLETYRL
jgi:hypothetical protein